MSTLFKTRGELISDVRTTLKENNVDSGLNDRQVWAKIKKHTNWLLSREVNKLKIMKYDTIFQTLKCVEVIDAPVIDDCCGVKSKCFVRRTKLKLPTMLESEDGVIIKSVFTIDGSQEFSPIKVSEYMRKLENPDSKYDKSLYYYFNNGYLYFPNNRDIKMVMVKALFEDDVVSNCDGGCDDYYDCSKPLYEMSFRFPPKLEGEIMSHVYQEFGLYKQIIADEQIDKNENRKN